MKEKQKLAPKGKYYYYWFLVIVEESFPSEVMRCLEDSAIEYQENPSDRNKEATKGWQEFCKRNEIETSIEQEFFGIDGTCYHIESMFRFRSHNKLTDSEILNLRENFETSINEQEGMHFVAYLGVGSRARPIQTEWFDY